MAVPSYIDLQNDYILVEETGTDAMGTTEILNEATQQGYVRAVPTGATLVAADDWVLFKATDQPMKIAQAPAAFTIVPISNIIFIYSEPPLT